MRHCGALKYSCCWCAAGSSCTPHLTGMADEKECGGGGSGNFAARASPAPATISTQPKSDINYKRAVENLMHINPAITYEELVELLDAIDEIELERVQRLLKARQIARRRYFYDSKSQSQVSS